MNRSVMARRAALANRPVLAPSTPGTNPALRSGTPVYATGPIRRSRAVKMTAIQRNAEGLTSEWNRSAHFWTDPKWSA